MKYSFTKPLKKTIISKLTKIWLFYITLSAIMIYALGSYLTLQRYNLEANLKNTESNINERDDNSKIITNNIKRLEYEISLDKTNTNYNIALKDALSNILNLIPDDITITQLVLEEKKLILKGTTPTREIFAFKLQAPLKAVFTTSNVNYFQLPNGWYNFTSISELKEE